VENIPLQAERYSGSGQKVFAFPPERCSPSDRNAVRDHNGMVFGFTPESRSPSTGFPKGMPINNTKSAHSQVKWEFAAFAQEFFPRIGL
jgi:hypothetical protein